MIRQLLLQAGGQSQPVYTFYQGADLLQKVSQMPGTHLYFLDIKIKDRTDGGLKLAQQLRRVDTQGQIVFVSSHEYFVLKTVSNNACIITQSCNILNQANPLIELGDMVRVSS